MTNGSGKAPRRNEAYWWLRRADQAAVAVLVLAGLAGTVGWFVWQGGLRGQLVEWEQAEPNRARFEVDINSASWPELAQLPGIGEELAKRIVASRLQEGPFRSHEELKRVRGIGAKTLETLRPHLRPMPGPDPNPSPEGSSRVRSTFNPG